jgi:hypothetical protein
MIEYVGSEKEGSSQPVFQLSSLEGKEILNRLELEEASNFGGVMISMLSGGIDVELAAGLLQFCSFGQAGGACLSLMHSDLGSGTDCEQRLFDLTNERRIREGEKVFAEKVKRDSSKEKDFAAAAEKRRNGQAGIDAAVERLSAIDLELADLEKQKVKTSWYIIFDQLQATSCNFICKLELCNCDLHATGLGLLTQVLLDLEHRSEGEKMTWLSLDGNDLTDAGMGILASFLRLSKTIEVLQVRNVGITEHGVSELVAGLVSNRSLRLLDVRSNGLCDTETAKAAIAGVQRFNTVAQILLT